MPFASDVLTLETDGPVATLYLDRPDKLNALGPDFFDDLPVAMRALGEDEGVRAVILAARGRAFCAGIDLRALGPQITQGGLPGGSPVRQRQALLTLIRHMQDALTSVAACPKPVIAAVHGDCVGAGVDLIAACDIRLAGAEAAFSIREVRMAMVADLGTLQRLRGIVPEGHLAELAYTGKDISAERAREIGLVNNVFESQGALLAAAHVLAGEIAANSPLAVQGTKAALRAGRKREVEAGLDRVALWNAAFLQSNDLAEAITAFMEKRDAAFSGE